MYFSMNTRSSPNDDAASERARAKPSRNLDGGMGDAHALAAAAGRGLDHHRIADLGGDLQRLVLVGDDAEMAGHGRDAGASRRLLRFDLVAHRLDGGRIRPDEDDAGAGQRLGKGGALGEEAIARMNRLGAGLAAGLDDPVDHQIGLRGGRGSDGDRLVGHVDVQRVGVGLGIDGDRGDAPCAARSG